MLGDHTAAERDAASDALAWEIRRSWFVDAYPNLKPSDLEQKLGMLLLKGIVFDMTFNPIECDYDELRSQIPAILSKKSKAAVRRWLKKCEKQVDAHYDEYWAEPEVIIARGREVAVAAQ